MNTLPSVLFIVVMIVAVVGWLALIFFPRRPWANFWFAGVGVPLALSLIYIYSLLTFWFGQPPLHFLDFATIDGVSHMFTNKGLLLVGWTNIVAMDLVAGAWMTRKAAQVNMPYVYLLPCLVATFVFAGVGFTLYWLIMALGQRWQPIAAVEQPLPVESKIVSATPRFP